jgi:hypothetical protein
MIMDYKEHKLWGKFTKQLAKYGFEGLLAGKTKMFREFLKANNIKTKKPSITVKD